MRMSRLWVVPLLVFIGAATALADEDSGAISFKVYGSNTVGAELAPTLVKKWMQQQGFGTITEKREGTELLISGSNGKGKGMTVELDSRGSTTGFAALKKGDADVAMSSRPIKMAEVAALKSIGRCDTAACEYVVALDGIAVIVNANNPLQGLQKAQIRDIFSGKVKEWKELGGKPGAIHLYALDDNSGTYDTFRSLVLGKNARLSGSAKRDSSHALIAQMVAKDPNGIGFVGLPFIGQNKALGVADGEAGELQPTPFSVATEDYVLARRLYFYLPERKAAPLAKSFVEYAVSHAGQLSAEQAGFVSQAIAAGEISLQQELPDEYRQLAADAKRLSVNFRFLPGSPKLDNKAQRDLQRLKEYIKGQGKKVQLMLFGFADSNESMPIVSLQLSMDRADTVADLLIKEGLTPVKVRGFGNAVPVASNETDDGRAKNRRVEVWIR